MGHATVNLSQTPIGVSASTAGQLKLLESLQLLGLDHQQERR